VIGVAFGLTVFGLVEHLLWPVRAADQMHARLADVFRSLAALARAASRPRDDGGDVEALRQLISQQVTDVQGFIESSKFELGAGAADAEAVERLTADAQTVFLVLLAIARDAESAALRPDAVRAASMRVGEHVAAILEGIGDRVRRGGAGPAIDVDGSLAAFERSIAAHVDAVGEDATYAGPLVLYRELAVAVNRTASNS
jgi:Fusaric acid resistance protein family